MGLAGAVAGFGAAAGIFGAVEQAKNENEAINIEQEATQQEQLANALFFEQQAKFERLAEKRELALFEDESEEFISEQVSATAASGVDMSGSALLRIGESRVRQAEERDIIRLESEQRIRDFSFQSRQARENARFAGRIAETKRTGVRLRRFANITGAVTGAGRTALTARQA